MKCLALAALLPHPRMIQLLFDKYLAVMIGEITAIELMLSILLSLASDAGEEETSLLQLIRRVRPPFLFCLISSSW